MTYHPRLTTRQLEVLCAIERSPDWSIDIAAHRLGISHAGVTYHVRRACRKCGTCSSHYQLIAYHVIAARPAPPCRVAPGQLALS
jgi:DNA-binding CsgD family transcriptional regulator